MSYALWFSFNATNNEAEYEALYAGLKIAYRLKVVNLSVFSGSQIIINQVQSQYQEKENYKPH